MGLFLMLTGIADCSVDEAEAALQAFATEKSGIFAPIDEENRVNEEEELTVSHSPSGHITIVYPSSIANWDEASQFLSATLHKSVFSLHIHDGDFWMYVFYVDGEQIDQFNPIPDYWGDMSEEELDDWKGSAALLCRFWPDAKEGQIANYFARWDIDDEESYAVKAYPEDEFEREDWQMIDFMNKVGLVYPFNADGEPSGSKYLFKVIE